jgi:hypothetical protein
MTLKRPLGQDCTVPVACKPLLFSLISRWQVASCLRLLTSGDIEKGKNCSFTMLKGMKSILEEDSSKSPPDLKNSILILIPCNDGWGCIQTLAVGQVGGSSPDLVSRRTLGLAAGRYNGQVRLSHPSLKT